MRLTFQFGAPPGQDGQNPARRLFHGCGADETIGGTDEAIFNTPRKHPETKGG
jgi:hypothetical protein